MTKDTKHEVLYALYSECEKDVPDIESVNPVGIDMDVVVFNAA